MRSLLSAAGRAFLNAAALAFLLYSTGIFAAPDLHRTAALAAAASLAALQAGIRAVQAYAPELTLSAVFHLTGTLAGLVDSFARSFVAAALASLVGVLAAPDLGTARALALAAIFGAFSAGLNAAEAFLQKGESPTPSFGLPEPRYPGFVPPTAERARAAA